MLCLCLGGVRSDEVLVYNRNGKAASTEMSTLIRSLGRANQFHEVNSGKMNPSAADEEKILRNLKPGDVWIQHARFVAVDRSGLRWINFVREPVDRTQSLYYYGIDPIRGLERAKEMLEKRRDVGICGCGGLEFDDCIRVRAAHKCPMHIESQLEPFCERKDNCTVQLAIQRAKHDFVVVGLVEEFELSIRLFEKLLPRFFTGATAHVRANAKRRHRYAGSATNRLTNTTRLGAVSKTTRGLLKAHATGYDDEIAFYNAIKKLFWSTAVAEFGSELRL